MAASAAATAAAAASASPPPPPTSLLWAHQLKREHRHLLLRMQDLEAQSAARDARLARAEESVGAQAADARAALAAQADDVVVRAGQDVAAVRVDVEKRLGSVEREVGERFEQVQAKTEDMSVQLAALREGQSRVEEEQQRLVAAGEDRVLLRQIGDVEEGLKKYERSLEQMGKRLDETRFEQIKQQLAALTKQVQSQGEQMKYLPESIKALQASNAELQKALEKNEAGLSRMAAKAAAGNARVRPVAERAVAPVESDRDAALGTEEDQPRKKTKTHKWAGGGADRDIIRTGAGYFSGLSSSQRSLQTPGIDRPKKILPPSPTFSRKNHPQPAISRGTDDGEEPISPKKSHRWSGGGADRGIIEAGISQFSGSKQKQSTEEVSEASKKDRPSWFGGRLGNEVSQSGPSTTTAAPQTSAAKVKSDMNHKERPSNMPETGPDEVIVRTGKGWYEIAGPPVTTPSIPPIKRKRGRPRKTQIAPYVSQEDILTHGRATRRRVYEAQDQQASGKRESGAASPSKLDNISMIKEERIAETPELAAIESQISHGDVEQNAVAVLTPSTEHLVIDQQKSNASAHDTVMPGGEQAPPQPRRQIVQEEDLATFIKRATE